MTKRARKHRELVRFEKSIKTSKKGCQKFGEDYKLNPYCVGVHGNHAEDLYPCLRYLVGKTK